MKFSNFLFPESREPAQDERVIDEAIAEAKLTEQLGFDVVWLAEHHFDGICAYVDPLSFAAALATATSRIKIGFAVAQVSLHHPIRLAEQISLLDNITKGRIIAGLGRGTAYNIYDYQGYDIPAEQAQERFEEVRGDHAEGLGRRAGRASRQILEPQAADAAAAAVHAAASVHHPQLRHRGVDAGDRASRAAVHDERAIL